MQMDTQELAGRCEALARFALMLAAQMEEAGVISGPSLTASMRQTADGLSFPAEHRQSAARTMHQLAGALDSAREVRRARAGRAGSR